MQYEIRMRDGAKYAIEAAYVEIVSSPTSTTYTLLGPVPNYPTAILAAFPAELVESVAPSSHVPAVFTPSSRGSSTSGPRADEQVPDGLDDAY